MSTRYIAKCSVCEWQWNIKALRHQSRTVRRKFITGDGCPKCNGEKPIFANTAQAYHYSRMSIQEEYNVKIVDSELTIAQMLDFEMEDFGMTWNINPSNKRANKRLKIVKQDIYNEND